jgi:hypothetical protein
MARRQKLHDISERCIDYLASVVDDQKEATKHRVAAARCLLEERQWTEDRYVIPERAFLDIFGGDAKAALTWMKQNVTLITGYLQERGAGEARDSDADAPFDPLGPLLGPLEVGRDFHADTHRTKSVSPEE